MMILQRNCTVYNTFCSSTPIYCTEYVTLATESSVRSPEITGTVLDDQDCPVDNDIHSIYSIAIVLLVI